MIAFEMQLKYFEYFKVDDDIHVVISIYTSNIMSGRPRNSLPIENKQTAPKCRAPSLLRDEN